jgi:predicted RNase H-like HicB family nuclease
MAPQIITITIEEVVEDGEKYYLARSPEVRGFLAETSTLEEMFTVAPQVMSEFLEASRRILAKEKAKQNFLEKYMLGKVVYTLNYQVQPHLQFA